ncbi:MAG: TonB-dependent receptor [Thiobacillaceae bacterium]|nr:TonB-dependent receptor [Thiobacillaceae bacterium]
MRRKILAALIGGLYSLPAQAQGPAILEEVIVTATRVPTPEAVAPHALEVHTRAQIGRSGATSLYEYLAHYSSVVVMPSFGNRHTPKLDLRGYGLGEGYQNIVVTVDGYRLNNIDLLPQWLAAIPLQAIERIEIVKGSGSVLYGDGAMAGGIHIVTRTPEGVRLAASAGNHGARTLTGAAAVQAGPLRIAASGLNDHVDGYAEPDMTGHRDRSDNRVWRGELELKPMEAFAINLAASSARIETRYPGPLTQAEFDANPAQNSGNTYNHQKLDADLWRAGVIWSLAPGWRLTFHHTREDKRSEYRAPWPYASDYDYTSDDLALQYRSAAFDLTFGGQRFEGERIGMGDRTHKDNSGVYVQALYRWGETTLSAGTRREWVDYAYAPTVGARLAASHRLHAWDLGLNVRLSPRLSLFANLDRAFQAPDIDRFFAFDFGTGSTIFNGFIVPARATTLTLGATRTSESHRMRLAAFYAKLKDEIYFNPVTFTNTNLDRTHKYGLELQDTWRLSPAWTARLNYTYTRAVIDRENDGGGAYDGKDLPGVPRHGVVLGLDWQPAAHWRLSLNQTWRSSAYALEDFGNTLAQRQRPYRSTDLALRYQHGAFEWSAAVENLFAQANGLWVKDDAIYPVNFTRNWRLGLKANF